MYYVNRNCLKVYTTLKSDKEAGRFKRPGDEFLFEDYKFARNPLPDETDFKHREGVDFLKSLIKHNEKEEEGDDNLQGEKQEM